MRKSLSSDAVFNIVQQSHCAGDGASVTGRAEHSSRIIEQFRHLILGERSGADELSNQSNNHSAANVTEFMRSAASEHVKSSNLRTVFCDDDGQLYRIDPKTGKFVPITVCVSSSSA
jgi:hypothetical protein